MSQGYRFSLFFLLAAALGMFVRPAPCPGESPSAPLYRQGTELFREGRFEEALRLLEEAASHDPSDANIQQGIAHAHASLGQELLHSGNLAAAREHLEKAVDREPEEASFHLLLGVIFFRLGDLYLARIAVDEALELKEDDVQAHEILGDISYQEGSLSRAVRSWENALEQAGRPSSTRLRQKIARAEKERDAEGGFGEDVSVHFTMKYDGPVPRGMAEAILEHLEEAYEMIGSELGHYPKRDITVILYSKVLFSEITNSPVWVAGSFDGKIRVPVGGLEGEHDVRRLTSVLTHELTHAFLRSMVPRPLPLWFEEGLAKHFEGLPTERAMAVVERSGVPAPRTFSALNMGLKGKGSSVEMSYLAALLAVRLLIEEEGFWTVRRILESAGEGLSFEEAFLEETRREVEEFEKRWSSNLP